MATIRALTVTVLVGIGFGCTGVFADDDLNAVCQEAQRISADASIPDSERLAVLQRSVEGAMMNPGLQRAMPDVFAAPRGERYAVLRAAAVEAGRADWSCPELEVLLAE